MSWTPKDREIDDLLSSDGKRRYEYFIRRVCDIQTVWGLYDDGWASIADEAGEPLLALWPHPVYAKKLATDDWVSYQPTQIPLREFFDEWMPRLKKDKLMLAIFPIPLGGAIGISAEDLEAGLRLECPEYYEA